jgi:hypothetical protein
MEGGKEPLKVEEKKFTRISDIVGAINVSPRSWKHNV